MLNGKRPLRPAANALNSHHFDQKYHKLYTMGEGICGTVYKVRRKTRGQDETVYAAKKMKLRFPAQFEE
jgi:hypothetical protein